MDGDANQFGTVPFYAAIGRAFVAMCAVIPVLFVIELIDTATHHWLDQVGGIRPRELNGLDGISVPLLVTGTFVLATGVKRFLLVTATVVLFSGLGDWLVGPANTVAIGASGVVFGYLGFLLVRGIVERNWWSI